METEGILKGAFETPDMSKANYGRMNPRKSVPVKNEESQTSDEESKDDPQPPRHTQKFHSRAKSKKQRRSGFRDSASSNVSVSPEEIFKNDNNNAPSLGLKSMFIGSLLGVMVFYWANPPNHPSTPNLSTQIHAMNVGLEKLINEFPDQRKLLHSFNASVINTLKYADRPATILVTSDETHRTLLDCFLKRLMRVAAQVMNTLPEIEGITAESFPDRAGLQSRLRKSLAKNKVVYLKDAHKISGQTALALKVICDKKYAPVKKAIVILSVTGPGLQASKVDVDGVLKMAWEPELAGEKYSAIFSQISRYLLYFKPDSQKISQYCFQ